MNFAFCRAGAVPALLLLLLLTAPGSAQDSDSAPTQRPTDESQTLLQMLELFDLGPSQMRFFEDGRGLVKDEEEPIFRLLYLLPRIDAFDLYRWSQRREDWQPIVRDPEAHRGQVFHVAGHVRSIERMDLPSESASRFRYASYLKVTLAATIDGRALVILCRDVPPMWIAVAEQGGRVPAAWQASCEAMFLKVGATQTEGEELVFAAHHVAWHPTQADPANGVSVGEALLGQAGMDLGLFSRVTQSQPLGHQDRDCFYQLLWTLPRLSPQTVRLLASHDYEIAALLLEPEQQAGQLFHFQGLARRVERIEVSDPDIRDRYQIDHYFEVDFFLPLEENLVLVDPDDGATREYTTYPMTVCVRQLPEGMPQGLVVRQPISFDGFYIKRWAYRSQFTSGEDLRGPRRQISPLLAGMNLRMVDQSAPAQDPILLGITVGFFVVVGLITGLGWVYRRSDRRFEKWRRGKNRAE